MRKVALTAVVLLLSSLSAFAGEWSGHLMDTMCAAKMLDKAASHTADCMKMCKNSGFGLVTKEGKYVKFNETGNAKAIEALEQSGKEDNLQVKVTGEMKGGIIRVESITVE